MGRADDWRGPETSARPGGRMAGRSGPRRRGNAEDERAAVRIVIVRKEANQAQKLIKYDDGELSYRAWKFTGLSRGGGGYSPAAGGAITV